MLVFVGCDASFTEPQYGDVIVLLAAHLLLDINKSSGNKCYYIVVKVKNYNQCLLKKLTSSGFN